MSKDLFGLSLDDLETPLKVKLGTSDLLHSLSLESSLPRNNV